MDSFFVARASSILSARSLARFLRHLVAGELAVVGLAVSTGGCVTCNYSMVVKLAPDASRTPSVEPAARACTCPAIDGVSTESCEDLGEEGTRCTYGTRSDPTDSFPAAPAEACRACGGALACVSTSAGAACVDSRCVGGRRYAGMTPSPHEPGLGGYFAEMAYLEAASVVAFTGLAADLRAAGAPAWLVRRCRAAARDEERHARAMEALAREHGWTGAVLVADAARPAHALASLFLENAVEGRREAYGALVAAWLARLVPARQRPTLRAIARDEARHAALSFVLEAWLETHAGLDEGLRRDGRTLREGALGVLETSEPDDAIVQLGGSARGELRARRALLRALRGAEQPQERRALATTPAHG